jgi:outer membrane receptor for ferric coprogen and ferric-rhodotorulic acid
MNQSTQLRALRWLLPAQLLLIANLASGQAQPSDASAEPDDDVVVLSPFEVVGDTTGYYKANTMSGTRFNAKLDDLASSISIVTTQQMADFGMLDLNDVFLYVAGTEGTGTYTDFTLDRNGSIGDNVQSYGCGFRYRFGTLLTGGSGRRAAASSSRTLSWICCSSRCICGKRPSCA